MGSRGIDNLSPIVTETVAYVNARGGQPFIVPAMGSHGGATAEGHAEVLASYGVSEQTVQAPVRATMEVVEKMALIGLGKREGALAVHRFGVSGLRELIAPGARRVLASGNILAGVGLVEDAYHKTMIVKVLNMPRLPVKTVDVLVIDRMGKDISGVGMDPNITGRIGVAGEHDPAAPHVGAMIVCDLTDQSHGNAIGVGLADVITRRLYDKIEHGATNANVITTRFIKVLTVRLTTFAKATVVRRSLTRRRKPNTTY